MEPTPIPLNNETSTQFGDNILFGLLQLGLPLDVALKLALKHQQETQQFSKMDPDAPDGSIPIPPGVEEPVPPGHGG